MFSMPDWGRYTHTDYFNEIKNKFCFQKFVGHFQIGLKIIYIFQVPIPIPTSFDFWIRSAERLLQKKTSETITESEVMYMHKSEHGTFFWFRP